MQPACKLGKLADRLRNSRIPRRQSRVGESRDNIVADIAAELVPIEEFDEHHAAPVIEGVKWGLGLGKRASTSRFAETCG